MSALAYVINHPRFGLFPTSLPVWYNTTAPVRNNRQVTPAQARALHEKISSNGFSKTFHYPTPLERTLAYYSYKRKLAGISGRNISPAKHSVLVTIQKRNYGTEGKVPVRVLFLELDMVVLEVSIKTSADQRVLLLAPGARRAKSPKWNPGYKGMEFVPILWNWL